MIKLKHIINEIVGHIVLVGVMKNVNGGLSNQFRVALSDKEPIHRLIKKGEKIHVPVKQIARHLTPQPHLQKWITHDEKDENAIIIPTKNKSGILKYKDGKLYYETSGDVFIVSLDVPSAERLSKKAKHDLNDFSINPHQFLPPEDNV